MPRPNTYPLDSNPDDKDVLIVDKGADSSSDDRVRTVLIETIVNKVIAELTAAGIDADTLDGYSLSQGNNGIVVSKDNPTGGFLHTGWLGLNPGRFMQCDGMTAKTVINSISTVVLTDSDLQVLEFDTDTNDKDVAVVLPAIAGKAGKFVIATYTKLKTGNKATLTANSADKCVIYPGGEGNEGTIEFDSLGDCVMLVSNSDHAWMVVGGSGFTFI